MIDVVNCDKSMDEKLDIKEKKKKMSLELKPAFGDDPPMSRKVRILKSMPKHGVDTLSPLSNCLITPTDFKLISTPEMNQYMNILNSPDLSTSLFRKTPTEMPTLNTPLTDDLYRNYQQFYNSPANPFESHKLFDDLSPARNIVSFYNLPLNSPAISNNNEKTAANSSTNDKTENEVETKNSTTIKELTNQADHQANQENNQANNQMDKVDLNNNQMDVDKMEVAVENPAPLLNDQLIIIDQPSTVSQSMNQPITSQFINQPMTSLPIVTSQLTSQSVNIQPINTQPIGQSTINQPIVQQQFLAEQNQQNNLQLRNQLAGQTNLNCVPKLNSYQYVNLTNGQPVQSNCLINNQLYPINQTNHYYSGPINLLDPNKPPKLPLNDPSTLANCSINSSSSIRNHSPNLNKSRARKFVEGESSDELDKAEIKREKNRQAAQRCRERKKLRTEQLEEELKFVTESKLAVIGSFQNLEYNYKQLNEMYNNEANKNMRQQEEIKKLKTDYQNLFDEKAKMGKELDNLKFQFTELKKQLSSYYGNKSNLINNRNVTVN